MPHVVAVYVVVSVARNPSFSLDDRRCAANVQRRGSAQCRDSRQREVAQHCAATWTSRVTDPCRWSSRRCQRLRQVALLTTLGLRNTAHGHNWSNKRNVGIAECSRQAGNHENIIVRAVLMTEWLSHADVVRSIDMLRVWMSVGGCAKMTNGDVCDVPSDYADTSAQICGHSEKVRGAEADPWASAMLGPE